MADSTISNMHYASGGGTNDLLRRNDHVLIDRSNLSYKAKIDGDLFVPSSSSSDAGKVLKVNSSGTPEFATHNPSASGGTITILWRHYTGAVPSTSTISKDGQYTLSNSRRFSQFPGGIAFVSTLHNNPSSGDRTFLYISPWYDVKAMRTLFAAQSGIAADGSFKLEFKWQAGGWTNGTIAIHTDTTWGPVGDYPYSGQGNNGYRNLYMILGKS